MTTSNFVFDLIPYLLVIFLFTALMDRIGVIKQQDAEIQQLRTELSMTRTGATQKQPQVPLSNEK